MRELTLVQPENATGAAARVLAAAQQSFGLTPNFAKAMAHSPTALRAYLDLRAALCRGTLPAAVREQLALLVAQHNRCDYCLSAHTYLGTKLAGLSVAEATLARHGAATDPLAVAALRFAAAVLRGQGRVPDAELDAARADGLSDGQLAEVIAHVGLNTFANYFCTAARIPVDWPLVRHTDT